MHLLEPIRFISEEGLGRSLRFVWPLMTIQAVRRRILAMRVVVPTYAENVGGIPLVGMQDEVA